MSAPKESKRLGGATQATPKDGVAAQPLSPGLWLVATPIGNAQDITLRALDVLRHAEVLACEDTRRTRKLMDIHGIDRAGREMISYNDQNGPQRRPKVMAHLMAGRSVAYASDAGTPLIADPGYRLVTEAQDAGVDVHTLPGPSAVLAALTLAGLPTDRFLFVGFLPSKRSQRLREINGIRDVKASLAIFESGQRIAATLSDLAETLGPDRQAAIIREATKMYEETRRGSLGALAAEVADSETLRGEIVVVVGPPDDISGSFDIDTMLLERLPVLSVKDAASEVAVATGQPRREIYARALELKENH